MRGYQRILQLFQIWDRREEAIAFAELIAALQRLDLDRWDLEGALTFGERTYGRASIRRRRHYEALVLCWRSGQRSPIHDHAGSSCAVRVIEGRATETQFIRSPCGRLVPRRSRTFGAGAVTGCCGGETHQMANLEPPGHDLITLHVYSPPPASNWRFYLLEETTLADHDRLIRDRPETVVVDFGRAVRPGHEGAEDGYVGPLRSVDQGLDIAIIGGGFSGTMVAVHLARLAGSRAPRVVLFEKADRPARGLAYGTRCDQHLLNVPAGLMSALPDQPTHFLEWLRAHDPSTHHGTFALRRVYGDYLQELLTAAARSSATVIDVVRDEVIDLVMRTGDGRKPIQLTTAPASGLRLTGSSSPWVTRSPRIPRNSSGQALPRGMSRIPGLPGHWMGWLPTTRSP